MCRQNKLKLMNNRLVFCPRLMVIHSFVECISVEKSVNNEHGGGNVPKSA